MEEENYTFHFETRLPLSQQEAFDWHKRPGMLERLTPPFVHMKLLSKDTELALGSVAHFKLMFFGSVGLDAYYEITDYQEGKSFTDKQVRGPFAFWEHHHRFKEVSSSECILEDEITFRVPLESFVGAMIHNKIARRLHHIFSYRRQVLLNDIDFYKHHKSSKKMHILMTGASGLIGKRLSNFLKVMGHLVVPITRHLQADEKGIFWDIENQKIDSKELEDFDAIIHLAGENVGSLWTDTKKEKIYKSRIHSTKLLVDALNRLESPPKTFITASGANFYQQGHLSSEAGEMGHGFLTRVIKDWEEESHKYKHGRVANMRTGVVLSPEGGMLKKLLHAFELGLGHKIGSGQNHLSWVSIDDVVYQYYHVLVNSKIEGPVNLASPHMATQEEFAKTLAHVLKRPCFFKLPQGLITSVFGEMAHETLLSDIMIEPKKLQESEAKFYYEDLDYALKHVLGASIDSH